MARRLLITTAAIAFMVAGVATAQNRNARAQRLVLDDNSGNTITIQTATGPITGGTLTIPDPAGSGSFLITTPSSGSQSVSGHLLPGTTNTFDLGSGTFLWRSLFLGSNAQIGGALRLLEPGGSDYSAFVAQAQANNITYTLPAVNGSAGQVLRVASSPAPTSTAATLEWGAGSSGWNLTGNAGLTDGTDNFFGTTSGVPVRFITSNTERMRLTPAGVLGLGTTTPDANAVLELERTSASFGGSGTYTAQRIDYSAGGFGVIHLYGLYADVYGTDDSAIGMHVIARGGNNVAGRFVATGGGLGIHVAQGNVLLSNAGTASELRMAEPSGSGTEYTAFKSQAQANNITYTLPATNGSAGQVLRVASSPAPTSTAATLEWGAGSSGWSLTGNASTTPGTNFLGTTDNQAFEIHVDEGGTATEGRRRVMRFEPNATSANIIGGFNGNSVTTGAVGATIAGGGANLTQNRVTDNYGFVGGGENNRAGNNIGGTTDARFATVVGGSSNKASGTYSVVGGGTNNTASGTSSVVSGGDGNTASGNSSTVGGGVNNTASAASASTVGGGGENTAAGDLSAIPGGLGLTLDASADGSFGFLGGNTGSNNMTISAPNVAVFGNTDLWLANNDNNPSELRFFEAYNAPGAFPSTANYTAFKAQAQTNNITYTLPAANGTDGQVLRLATGATATAGTLEWAAASGLTLPFSSTTSSASTLFDITNSGAGQAANFNISGAKTASTTTAVVDNDATNTTTDAINKTVLSVASSGDFSGAGGGSTTAIGLDVNMTGTGGDLNRGVKIAVAGNDAVGLQISSGRVQLSVATITYATTMTAPNNAAIIRVLDSGGNTGNSTLTLSTTDIAEGQICWVYNSDVNDNVVVQSTPTITVNSGATNRDLWQFIYIDGAWRPLRD